MKKYGIYQGVSGDYVAVKHGFAYPGLLFGFLWLAYKGMLVRGMMFWFVYAILGNLIYGMESNPTFLDRGLMSLIPIFHHPPLIENPVMRLAAGLTRTIVLGLVIGAFGNEWRKRKLLKKGYAQIEDIEARSERAALQVATQRR